MAQQDSSAAETLAEAWNNWVGPRASLWEELDGNAAASWREYLIVVAAEMAVAPEIDAAHREMEAVSEEAEARLPKELAIRLSNSITKGLTEIIRSVALAGYALAKTWPEGVWELAEWPARARAYLEMDRKAEAA